MRTLERPANLTFPDNFLWGSATAAYQIEGSPTRHGGGPSVWDEMCKRPGKVFDGHSGQTACDHYRLFKEDVAMMRDLGHKVYRFSLSWPRLFPEGTGRRNDDGYRFYNELVDELLKAGIKPFVTLFHWDYPHELYKQGGWMNPQSPQWFEEYTADAVGFLSDRVSDWITMNETVVFLILGHLTGVHAPGTKFSRAEVMLMLKHALLAHGRSCMAVREHAKTPARVSYAPVASVRYPTDESPEAVEAARRATFAVWPDNFFWSPALYFEPVLKGVWPEDVAQTLGDDDPRVTSAELATMHQKIDVLGLNFYQADPVAPDHDGVARLVRPSVGAPRTAFDWPVTPDGIYWSVRFFWERYGVPLFITENGTSCTDWVALDGGVHDPQRIDYTRRYLQWLHRATAEGVPVEGYTHWSLMDNFEWAEGYKQRFGLVHVDFETLKRTPKDSAYWYRDVIASNGAAIW
ncbi:MAG: beta-glucosidase [Fimbriimonadaceae bacterium]|nr:beta-glucosidase [Fimbriimonadaceae bacterium]